MWYVEVLMFDEWIKPAKAFESRDDAEWAIAMWKQTNNCRSDISFRTVFIPPVGRGGKHVTSDPAREPA